MSTEHARSSATILRVDFAANARRRGFPIGRSQSYDGTCRFDQDQVGFGSGTAALHCADTLSCDHDRAANPDGEARTSLWTKVAVTAVAGLVFRALWKR